ncbi:ASCH domain-containing protein [Porphyrobacter sp. YT40]|uniref:ASCH domain-containing protein n=1 Tax=Porphyrobacter sp. YT40 TaxID=2547601 RepID=UPI0011417601|nr:ASCH domain-containing protein [Porphyrobacter sp. YT40]QDH35823.1 ASCH domain-containing protein [Porphyrobacter sp. YT40]
MVAYSFAPQFIEPIVTRAKRQTVRAERRRHAREGEAIQLYTAMRTKQCRKLIEPDPICIGVQPITITIDAQAEQLITGITVGHVALSDVGIERFAERDGFGSLAQGFARRRMGEFWLKAHAELGARWVDFEGVCIRWGWPS